MLHFNENKVTLNHFYTNYIAFIFLGLIICFFAFSFHFSFFYPLVSGSETLQDPTQLGLKCFLYSPFSTHVNILTLWP
jgi:hypothetical protein